MSDFLISDGNLYGEFSEQDSIYNLLYTSINIRKGSLFADLNFGSELHLLKREKNTLKTLQTAERYCKEATAWIIRSGKADSISVFVETDLTNKNRINIKISAIDKIKREVSFNTFVEVV